MNYTELQSYFYQMGSKLQRQSIHGPSSVPLKESIETDNTSKNSFGDSQSNHSSYSISYQNVEVFSTQLPELKTAFDRKLLVSFHKNPTFNAPTAIDPRQKDDYLHIQVFETLSQYRGMLYPWETNLASLNFVALMSEMFEHVNSKHSWFLVRTVLRKCIAQLNPDYSVHILMGKSQRNDDCSLDTKELFFSHLIQLFFEEKYYLYGPTNQVICSTDDDVNSEYVSSLGPYALVLNSLLINWSALPSYRYNTFILVRLDRVEWEFYQVGRNFVWFSFVFCSSEEPSLPKIGSINKEFVIFEIDNSFTWKWYPRYVADIAECKGGREYLYPFGAKFKVRDRTAQKISLKLLNF